MNYQNPACPCCEHTTGLTYGNDNFVHCECCGYNFDEITRKKWEFKTIVIFSTNPYSTYQTINNERKSN
jgi:uncharacterized Zn finger protein